MLSINNVLNATNEDIISTIFNEVYALDLDKLDDKYSLYSKSIFNLYKENLVDDNFIENFKNEQKNTNVTGYYISINKDFSKYKDLHPIFSMFICIEKNNRKIYLGETNSSDLENTLQDARLFILECLTKLLNSEFNSSLEPCLQINSINDFKNILKDECLSRKLSNFIISVCSTYAKTHIKYNNPDYRYVWDKVKKKMYFEKIKYEYIDKNNFEILESSLVLNDDNKKTLIQYILENYLHLLSYKQLQFFNDMCSNNSNKYSKQLIYNYKKNIRTTLMNALEEDKNIKKIYKNCELDRYALAWG